MTAEANDSRLGEFMSDSEVLLCFGLQTIDSEVVTLGVHLDVKIGWADSWICGTGLDS